MQRDPKDKESEFESCVFPVFLHDLDDPNDLPSVNMGNSHT